MPALRLITHVGELRLSVPTSWSPLRDDQCSRFIRTARRSDRAGDRARGRHRAGIRIGEGDLLIGAASISFSIALRRFTSLRA